MHPRFCGQRSPWCRSTRNASPAMFPEMDLMGVEPIAPILQRSAASSGIQAREQGRGLWHTPHSVLPAEAEGLEPSSEQLATCFQDRLLIRPVDFPMRTAWDPSPPRAASPRGERASPSERGRGADTPRGTSDGLRQSTAHCGLRGKTRRRAVGFGRNCRVFLADRVGRLGIHRAWPFAEGLWSRPGARGIVC